MQRSSSIGNNCTEGNLNSLPELFCVEYPGVVKNVPNMLETLGGLSVISKVSHEHNLRLELRFRPRDAFCKPTCAERQNVSALVVKVIRRRRRGTQEWKYSTQMIGMIKHCYKFNNLCDFQYLPMVLSDGTCTPLHHQLIPHGITDQSWLSTDVPLFLPPAAFSRMDTPQEYCFRRNLVTSVKEQDDLPANIISKTRKRRTGFTIFVNFDSKDVPVAPLDGAVEYLRLKFVNANMIETVRKAFESRPIWSKLSLEVELNMRKDILKYLLPVVAYIFFTGPWRNLWVRLGYDPRKNPESRIYQVLDYRIRGRKIVSKVPPKRSYSNFLLPYKSQQIIKPKTSMIIKSHLQDKTSEDGDVKETDEQLKITHKFRPGIIPPWRQMMYQFCDIEIPEVESFLREAPTVICTEKRGWLPEGSDEKCRKAMSFLIEKEVLKDDFTGPSTSATTDDNSSGSDFHQSSPDSDTDSD